MRRDVGFVMEPGAPSFVQALDDAVIALMIEKDQAVQNLESLLSVKGVDMVQFGPADYALSNNSHKVTVVGYTDTSGSAAYNIKLSQRRASSTAKALVADGVANADVSVSWKGETDLAVPTADGVREPRNRRATIDIQF